jgi:alpha-ketoglutaric semialdehyde dehydrogenase
VNLGPLVDDRALDAMEATVSTATSDGATVVTGGQRADGDGLADGWFFPPTVIADARPEMELSQREVFGPVIGFERVGSLDEAITSANAVDYGLSAAICTRSLAAAQQFAERIEAGMVRVNRPTVGAAFNAPFGGIKQSGTATHREQLGPTVMDFYTVSRTVWLGH